MRILQLCSDYPFTNVYRELFSALDRRGIEQIIYIPIRNEKDIGAKQDTGLQHAEYVYSCTFTSIDRIAYHHKVNKILRDVKARVNLGGIDLVHAHFLFSLGGIARKLKQEMGIDYITSIRNTDVNCFFKYRLLLRKQGIRIMRDARRVAFISPAYKEKVVRKYVPSGLQNCMDSKSAILPNGVNDFWLKNKACREKAMNGRQIRLIYVGALRKNKNIETSIRVAEQLAGRGYKATLKIVGGGPEEGRIKLLAKKNRGIVQFCGYVAEREKLLELYGESDIFVMPSITETFGVAYIEALSQGLPVIYSRGEGIDGFFRDGEVGFAVNPRNIGEIVERIEDICESYSRISRKCITAVKDFSWTRIGQNYIKALFMKNV